jgi:hypothetical protein
VDIIEELAIVKVDGELNTIFFQQDGDGPHFIPHVIGFLNYVFPE